MKRLLGAVIVVLLVGAFVARGVPAQPTKKDPPKKEKLMQRKLEHTQRLLEGLALNDFALIERNAEELVNVSKLAEWRVLRTPQYEVYSNEFRRIATNLIDNAKKKNIDAASLSYVELTLNCVKCHKHVREIRMTSLD